MIDRTNWDQWKEQGRKGFRERAAEVIDELLDDYEVDPLEPKLHEEIRELFEKTAKDSDVELPAF
jgi:trimethylamine:corrinoid methyltransferase-like protein